MSEETVAVPVIRYAILADVEALMPLVEEFMALAPLFVASDMAAVRQVLSTMILADASCVIVAAEDEDFVGMVVAHCVPYLLNPAVLIVQEQAFFVRPAVQATGIGTQLLQALEAWATYKGAQAILMSGFEQYPMAQAMYVRRGYRAFERHYVKELP
jgi:GNAT superfamily N-acetyltransferase